MSGLSDGILNARALPIQPSNPATATAIGAARNVEQNFLSSLRFFIMFPPLNLVMQLNKPNCWQLKCGHHVCSYFIVMLNIS